MPEVKGFKQRRAEHYVPCYNFVLNHSVKYDLAFDLRLENLSWESYHRWPSCSPSRSAGWNTSGDRAGDVGRYGRRLRSDVYAIVGLSRTLVGSQSFDADPKRPLQLEQFGALFSGEQCGRHSAASGPPGSSDTVDEIF